MKSSPSLLQNRLKTKTTKTTKIKPSLLTKTLINTTNLNIIIKIILLIKYIET